MNREQLQSKLSRVDRYGLSEGEASEGAFYRFAESAGNPLRVLAKLEDTMRLDAVAEKLDLLHHGEK